MEVGEERTGTEETKKLVTVTTVGRFQNYIIIYSASGWVRVCVCVRRSITSIRNGIYEKVKKKKR